MKRFCAALSALLALSGALPLAVAAQADDAGLVFYDSISTDRRGAPELRGGVYLDSQQAELVHQLRSQKGAAVPPDGYYHIRFVADAAAMGRAQDYADLLLKHEAFASIRDRFRIEYVQGDPDKMNCRNDLPDSPRIISCDMAYILSLGNGPTHLTAVFTSRGSGGAGGSVSIASLNYPLNTMLHEMLHVWKLNDEYTYSEGEAARYCKILSILKGPNTAAFPARAAYASNDDALGAHAADIPWLRNIKLPITTTGKDGVVSLGTPPALAASKEPGLFSPSDCSRMLPSYRPYGGDNIMKTLSSNYIPPIHRDAVLAEIARVAGWQR